MIRTIILHSTIVEKVKQLTGLMVWIDQAENMCNIPLSPTGELPATHYISSWIISDEFALLLPLYENWEKVYEWNKEIISNASWVSVDKIEDLFSLMYVSEEDSNTAINRLWLKLINNY